MAGRLTQGDAAVLRRLHSPKQVVERGISRRTEDQDGAVFPSAVSELWFGCTQSIDFSRDLRSSNLAKGIRQVLGRSGIGRVIVNPIEKCNGPQLLVQASHLLMPPKHTTSLMQRGGPSRDRYYLLVWVGSAGRAALRYSRKRHCQAEDRIPSQKITARRQPIARMRFANQPHNRILNQEDI